MPAKSEAQRRLMAIAEHHPEKLHKENRGVLSMSHKQLHEFADTKGLHKEHVHQHLQTEHHTPHKGVTVDGEANTGAVAGSLPAHKHEKVMHHYKKD